MLSPALSFKAPKSILIIGSGAFGLSTALELSTNALFKNTRITLVDRLPFPATDGASIDTSRVVRADYADPAYAHLGEEAQKLWRADWGADNRYHETGLVFAAEPGQEAYVHASLENVQSIENAKQHAVTSVRDVRESFSNPGQLPALEVLPTPEAIARVTKMPGACGSLGYINRRSGWADAEATMRYLRHRVESLNRVTFVHGTVRRLLFSADGNHVLGAHIADSNEILHAELTILAAGAWTTSLVDLRGILQATGQVMAYIPLSDAEASELSKTPVQLNMSTGLFVIPPLPPPPTAEQHITSSSSSSSSSKQLFFKIARHAHGYTNPTKIPHPELPNQTITISTPRTNPNGVLAHQPVPASALSLLRSFLVQLLTPATRHSAAAAAAAAAAMAHRPFSHTRLCHYADTPTGDFLLDYHPKYGRSLFVASGGSGHAFKFLPVLGRCVVDCMRGQCAEKFRDKWAWREKVEGEWSTADGSRGGERLLPLEDEGLDGQLRSKL